jgi:hypothetical protein
VQRSASFTLPPKERQTLLRFYRSLLQRHLYCHPGKKLLSKNAAFATWGTELKATLPQARFLVCLREPATALSSQLSSLAGARQLSGSDPDGSLTRDLFTDLYAAGYRDLAAFISACPTQQTALIAQSDLRSDPAGTIRAALRQTGIELGPILTASLDQLRPAPPSGHQHSPEDFSLDTEQLRDCMRPAYEAMLQSPNRCRP